MSDPTPPLTDAVVADYLRQRACEITVELHATNREAEAAHHQKGELAAQRILGPRKLREDAAARVKVLHAAADALDAEQKPVRQITWGPEHEVLSTLNVAGLKVLGTPLEPQPPSAAESKGQPYGFYQPNGFSFPDEWKISGAVGFVRERTGQSAWRCPFGSVGEVVKVDDGWWEVIDVRVERWNGDGDWMWVGTFRRAEMADWRVAP